MTLIVNKERYTNMTAGELIELLPACIDTKKNEPFNYFWLQIIKRNVDNIKYIVRYMCDSFTAEEAISGKYYPERIYHHTCSLKLTDALAEMLVFLIENKLIEAA
jgi:hypothetical protein